MRAMRTMNHEGHPKTLSGLLTSLAGLAVACVVLYEPPSRPERAGSCVGCVAVQIGGEQMWALGGADWLPACLHSVVLLVEC